MSASNWPGLAIPKPEPRWKTKQRKASAELKLIKEVYAQVDKRDGHCCRICFKRVGGIGVLYAAHHHHLISRSIASRDEKHTTKNIVTLCPPCHDAVENSGLLKLEGDADARNSVGVLNGLTLWKAGDGDWLIVGHR